MKPPGWWIDQFGTEPYAILDCIEGMRRLPPGSVDTIITDPPYALVGASRGGSSQPGDLNTPYGRSGPSKKRGFMGEEWDGKLPGIEVWKEALRIAKPGAIMLCFGGTRTFHRLTCAIEDAGWEIRDCMMWLYGSGFPKNHDIAKTIDKQAGRIGQSVIKLKERLIGLFDASGKTRKQIDEECGFRACNYLTLPGEGKKPDPWINVLPTREKWEIIKRVIGYDSSDLDECYEEAEREVIGTDRAGKTSLMRGLRKDEIGEQLDDFFSEAEREVIGTDRKARTGDSMVPLPTKGAEATT